LKAIEKPLDKNGSIRERIAQAFAALGQIIKDTWESLWKRITRA